MDDYYEACRCPHCKHKLDEVNTDSKECPHCLGELVSRDVWMTRKYSGQLNLPNWVSAFGWPLLLMAVGVALALGMYMVSEGSLFNFTAVPIGIGFVWFMVKLMTDYDD